MKFHHKRSFPVLTASALAYLAPRRPTVRLGLAGDTTHVEYMVITKVGRIAQSVEHSPFKRQVLGSILVRPPFAHPPYPPNEPNHQSLMCRAQVDLKSLNWWRVS